MRDAEPGGFVILVKSTMSTHDNSENGLLARFMDRRRHSGEAAASADLLERLLTHFPREDTSWRQVGEGLLRAGCTRAAVEVLNAAVAQFEDSLTLRYWRGNALRLDGQQDAAERDFRSILIICPDHRNAALSLAHMLRESGRISAATAVMCASVRACESDQPHVIAGLTFLRECDAHSQAYELAMAARARWPSCAQIAALFGEFALALGNFSGARKALRVALEGNAGDGMSWLRLAYCGRCTTSTDPDLNRIEAAWRNCAHDSEIGTCLGFALGKMLSDIGERSRAVTVLRDANASAAAQSRWCASDWHAFVNRRLRDTGLPELASKTDYVPVFIVGMPRTGTTLAASLLSGSGELCNRGELNWVGAMYALLDEQGRLHNRDAIAATRAVVHAQFRRDDPPCGWYLDKNPLNFRHLDLIAAMFPGAKIIHCRRGRRDTALSLWMQHFAHPDLGFSNDFADIAAFMDGHDKLIDHWHRTLPLDWYDLEYETLASNPGEVLSAMREFLGMTACHASVGIANQQAVTTASVWQVRQPLSTNSINRWRTYARYLPELERMF